MSYILSFIGGAVAGIVITYFVVKNNAEKAKAIIDKTQEKEEA